MNFLFVSLDKFPPFRVDLKILFGREMIKRGHKIHWLLQSEEPCSTAYETKWSGCKVWVGGTDLGASLKSKIRKQLLDILNDIQIFKLSRKNRYDFIQVKDKFITALLGILSSRIRKCKFFFWLSYPFPEASLYRVRERTAPYPLFYFIRGIIFKFLLYSIIMPLADHIFVQSQQMKKDAAIKGISEEKITPVPMGVALDSIPYASQGVFSGSSKKEKIVLYLGTLIKVRKMDFLIRVFENVLPEVPAAKLFMVGGSHDPKDMQILVNQTKSLGIEKSVVFTGFLPMEKAWAFVDRASVCVSPFYPTPILNSTSPTKLIEYMAMGKPVVANDHPEQRLVILESGGGICVPYEEKAFAEAIIALLKNPEAAEMMGKNGRVYVEKYRNYKTICETVEKQYLRLCCKNSKRFSEGV
jgi:glycosyltransferase involved in cell wall biosynthesis